MLISPEPLTYANANHTTMGVVEDSLKERTIAPAASMTHQHIVAVINTLLAREKKQGRVRILDMGCGNGSLLAFMLDAVPVLRPQITFEVFGMDVADAGQQHAGYMVETAQFLQNRHPGVNWRERLSLVSTQDKWPFPDGSFDFITSNQVLEHVGDHNFVFTEMHRCLSSGGVSINLFPTRQVLWEGHALMPLVHKIRNETKRARLMLFFAKIGFTKLYNIEMARRGWKSLDEFARVFAHVLQTDTNYVTGRELVLLGRRANLEPSFAYTKDYFTSKLLSFLGRRPYLYRNSRILDWIGYVFGRYISSVTFLLMKRD